MKHLITDIQRFSLSDGPGLRTTVFFKGCNMHCTWCHNPETLSMDRDLMFYPAKCIGCGRCFSTCENGAHKIENGIHIIDRSLCTKCGKCAEKCYAEALTMSGKEMSDDTFPYRSFGKIYFSSHAVCFQNVYLGCLY